MGGTVGAQLANYFLAYAGADVAAALVVEADDETETAHAHKAIALQVAGRTDGAFGRERSMLRGKRGQIVHSTGGPRGRDRFVPPIPFPVGAAGERETYH